jgi:hypothetical protein
MNGEDYARYQLIARATYLPKGYLVAAATYLRFASGISWSAIATYLRLRLWFTKPRFRLRLRWNATRALLFPNQGSALRAPYPA